MIIACPHCQAEFDIPDDRLRCGVARVSCEHCAFNFVVRLGDPASSSPPKKAEPPLPLEGVKASNATPAAAGEIGTSSAPKFVATDTRTTVLVSPELQVEMATSVDQAMVIEPSTPSVKEPTLRDIEAGGSAEPVHSAAAATHAEDASPDTDRALHAEESECVPLVTEDTSHLGAAAPVDGAIDSVSDSCSPERSPSGDRFEAFRAPEEPVHPPPGADTPPSPGPVSTPWGPVDSLSTGALVAPMPSMPLVIGGAPPSAAPVAFYPYPVLGAGAPPATITYPSMAGPSPVPGMQVVIPYPPGFYPGVEELAGDGLSAAQPTAHGMRAVGLGLTLLMLLAVGFFTFVLARNGWSLDLANFGAMLDRAFGNGAPKIVDPELQGLETNTTGGQEAKLQGETAVAVVGVVKNNDTRPRRFIYVCARLRDGHGRLVLQAEAPAGNVFTKEELGVWSRRALEAHLNPAGRDGSNARVEPGSTVAFMVVITGLPADYTSSKYRADAEVCRAELYQEP